LAKARLARFDADHLRLALPIDQIGKLDAGALTKGIERRWSGFE